MELAIHAVVLDGMLFEILPKDLDVGFSELVNIHIIFSTGSRDILIGPVKMTEFDDALIWVDIGW